MTSSAWWLRTAWLVALAGTLAYESPAEEKAAANQLAALLKEHEEAEAALRKAAKSLEESKDGGQKLDELFAEFYKAQSERFARAVEIAKAHPGTDTAVQALEWVLTTPASYHQPAGLDAMDEVAKHHSASPKVGKLVAWVGYLAPPEQVHPRESEKAWAMIDAVARNNPDKTVRAQAYLMKAYKAKKLFDTAEYRNDGNANELALAAEKEYEAVIHEYGDCPWLMSRKGLTVRRFAERELYELRHLRIGKVAPEIEAEGVDGKKFKLSDHRGKVVALIFWASWCGPCMAEVPHEREMTERFRGRPFTIVGVNGDGDREKAAEVMKRERMTWPSFWNGSEGPSGPISTAWNIRGWPTVYVLDAKGVIRFKHLRGKELEEKVGELLAEAEADK
jgi:thiol-disulfide isomerase/thioredoxin